MKISSVFFTEAEGSTPEKRIYKFNDEYKDVVTRNSDTFAILKGSVVGDLSIIVEQDKLTFENEFSGNTKEIYTYYDAGKVKDFTTAIYEDCSALTWSELLSNQPADLEKFYSGTITKEYLDQIPVIGGKRSLAVLNFNKQRGDLAQVLFSISDYMVFHSFLNMRKSWKQMATPRLKNKVRPKMSYSKKKSQPMELKRQPLWK